MYPFFPYIIIRKEGVGPKHDKINYGVRYYGRQKSVVWNYNESCCKSSTQRNQLVLLYTMGLGEVLDDK